MHGFLYTYLTKGATNILVLKLISYLKYLDYFYFCNVSVISRQHLSVTLRVTRKFTKSIENNVTS